MAQTGTYTLLRVEPCSPTSYDVYAGKAQSRVLVSCKGGSYVANGIPIDFSTDLSYIPEGIVTRQISVTKRADYVRAGTSYAASGAKFKIASNGTEIAAGTVVTSFVAELLCNGPMASSIA